MEVMRQRDLLALAKKSPKVSCCIGCTRTRQSRHADTSVASSALFDGAPFVEAPFAKEPFAGARVNACTPAQNHDFWQPASKTCYKAFSQYLRTILILPGGNFRCPKMD